jgi:BolA family transcriptional regulator, general stress-responsive regulator
MTRYETALKLLNDSFHPGRLEIVNESHLHAGHHHGDGRPFDGTGETHFRVRIISAAFAGKSRLDRHRAINAALAPVLDDGLHALAVEASAPGEAVRW